MGNALTTEQELKLHVLANGIKIQPEANQAWHELYAGPVSLNEYASTAGICLEVPDENGGVWINAPYTQEFTEGAQARLCYDAQFFIELQGMTFDTNVIPVPLYHEQTYTDEDGTVHPFTNLGVTHTDRVRISPVEGCGMVCKFCNIPYELKYHKKPRDQMLEVIKLAKDDPQTPARHVLISGGTPKLEDEDWEDETYEFIVAESPLPVDIMMTPREDKGYIRRLGEVGVNSMSINIEVFDPERARKLIPTKNRRFGPQGYLDYIEGAVNELGVGRVQSLILFGQAIEPLETTLAGVKALVERGCIPVLSPFRPDARTPMEHDSPSSEEEMRMAWEKTVEICEDANTGVKPGPRCVPCHHNTVTFSDGSDFYVPLGEDLTRPIHAA